MNYPCDGFLAIETHITGYPLLKTLSKLFRSGYYTTYALPYPSEHSEGGTQGGAIAAYKKSNNGTHLLGDTLSRFGHQSHRKHTVGFQVNIRGTLILIITSYHRGGIDDALLGEIFFLTRGGSYPSYGCVTSTTLPTNPNSYHG